METLREAGMYDSELEGKLRNLFEDYFPQNLEFPEAYLKQHPDNATEQKFIGYGEVMSAHVLSHILDTRFQVANTIIDHAVRVDTHGRNLSRILRDEVGKRVENGLQNGLVIVP